MPGFCGTAMGRLVWKEPKLGWCRRWCASVDTDVMLALAVQHIWSLQAACVKPQQLTLSQCRLVSMCINCILAGRHTRVFLGCAGLPVRCAGATCDRVQHDKPFCCSMPICMYVQLCRIAHSTQVLLCSPLDMQPQQQLTGFRRFIRAVPSVGRFDLPTVADRAQRVLWLAS